MPPALAKPGQPRDLATAEWRALERLRHRKRPQFVAIGFVPLLGALVLAWPLVRGGWTAAGDPVGTMVGALVLAALAALPMAAAFLPQRERPGGKPRRVGRLQGLYNVVGKPARPTVGGVWVVLPDGWTFDLYEDVDVEITPPLEDDPRPAIARRVVSARAGRLRIADQAAVA